MLDETLINDPLTYYTLRNSNCLQPYPSAMDTSTLETNHYDIHYRHSILESDNVNDSIKVKILYNELMTLKSYFSDSERRLKAEVDVLQDKNKKLEDEIASIKQALYFG